MTELSRQAFHLCEVSAPYLLFMLGFLVLIVIIALLMYLASHLVYLACVEWIQRLKTLASNYGGWRDFLEWRKIKQGTRYD